ncbi:SMI1/KNR4 family protein [Gynuella sp.]|uniref:SMI1/KNR4 family protein n=1 Tax=Gynuella sp. TaxID=2969146 RepID=UPI003D1178F1
MTITTFSDIGSQLSKSDLAEIEKRLGFQLPDTLKVFYLQTNGGTPEPDHWIGDNDFEPIYVSGFLKMKDASPNESSLEDTYQNGVSKGIIPTHLLPFALDWGNNYICIDMTGKVFFLATDSWHDDLSMEDNVKKNTRLLCNTLDEFIDSLVSEDEAYG